MDSLHNARSIMALTKMETARLALPSIKRLIYNKKKGRVFLVDQYERQILIRLSTMASFFALYSKHL